MARLDLTGQVFGKLTVIGIDEEKSNKKRTYWKCQCECGNKISSRTDYLRGGKSKSCGCYRDSVLKTSYTKHGMHGTRFYRIWKGMLSRCYCETDTAYNRYGARGIKVCKEWKDDFQNFYNDMYSSYQGHCNLNGEKDTTIERIDFNENYSRENCTWKTNAEQSLNKRNNIKVEGKTLKEISEEYNIPLNKLRNRRDYLKRTNRSITINNIVEGLV